MKKWIIIASVLLLISLTIYWKMSHSHPSPIATVEVKRGTINEESVAVGDILPKHSITVKSQLSGIITGLSYEAGDYVHKGDVLLEIQPNPTPDQYAKALSLLKEDQADVDALMKKMHNYDGLIQSKNVTENYQDAVILKGELAHAKANLEYDQQFFDLLTKGNATIEGKKIESVVTSPVDGFILQRNVDVGDPVVSLASNQAATVLFTIANMDNLIFKGSVDEIDAGKLTLNMPAVVEIAALPGQKVKGILTQLSLQSEQASTNDTSSTSPFNVGFQVEISQLDVPAGVLLRSGYSATATIIVKTVSDVLLIPESAVLFKEHKTYVQLPPVKNGQATEIQIDTGLSDGMLIEVKKGLTLGQTILKNPIINK